MHSSVHSSLFTISNTWKQLKCPSTEERIKKIYLSIHVHIVVQLLSPVWLLWPCELQHTRLPCPSLSPWVCSNSCPLSWWHHPTISSTVTSFYSCLQSFPAAGSFPVSQLFASGDPSIATSASASLRMHIQGWFPVGLTGLISLLSKGLSRVFSSTTIWKHF